MDKSDDNWHWSNLRFSIPIYTSGTKIYVRSIGRMFKVGDWVKTAGALTGEIIETEAGGMFRVKTHEGNFWHHYSLLSYLKRPKASRDRKVEIFVDGELKAKFVVNPGESITYLVK